MKIQKAKRAAKALIRKIFPKTSVILFPTYFCNYRCPYCEYNAQEFPARFPRSVEHGAEEWVAALEQFRPADIAISGGETLSYRDIVPLVNGLRQSHTVGLTTNLSLPLDDFIAGARRDIGVTASFHPHTADLEEFAEKVLLLRERGFLNLNVNFVAYPDMIHRLPELRAFFAERKIPFHVEAFIHPSRRYALEEERVVGEFTDCLKLGFDESRDRRRCLAGSRHFAVAPSGDVFACVVGIFYGTGAPLYERFGVDGAPFRLGNLFDGMFRRAEGPRTCDAPCSAACDIRGAVVEILERERRSRT